MNRIVIICALLFAATFANAQKNEKKSCVEFLKGQTELNVVFDYSSTLIDGKSVDSFFNMKSTEDRKRNNWLEYWNGELQEHLYQTFCENVNNEATSKTGITCGNFPGAAYTAVIKMITIDEDGEFAALINFKEQNSDNNLFTTRLEGKEGSGKLEKCFEESYEDGGENFGEFLKKNLK